MLKTTNYIIAGGMGFLDVLRRSVIEINEKENMEITQNHIENFCEVNFSKVLLSFGANVKENNLKNKDSYQKTILNSLKKTSINIKNLKKYLDSGGFQISMGYVSKDKIETFTDAYYNFLKDYNEYYDYAFSLDVPPNENVFSNFDEVKDFNIKSYEKIYYNLPSNVIDKMIYVYHFRTPKTNEIWYDITFGKNGIFNNIDIKNWSVGGIVTKSHADTILKYIIYSLPLTIILKKLIEKNIKEFNFHVLGACTYKDILFYALVEKLIMEKFNIKINITFDSSGLFKQLLMGRKLDFIEDDDNEFNIHSVNISSSELFKKNRTLHKYKNIDICFKIFDMLNNKFNMPKFNHETIYNEQTNTFYRSSEIYLCMYLLYFYYKLQYDCKKLANEIYPIYNSNKNESDKIINHIVQKLNRGILSKKTENKLLSFTKSLQLIEDLDVKKTEMIINKYLVKDEFNGLVRKVPTF